MIDLYGMTSPNVQKIILALEELELPYRFHYVDVFTGEQFTPAFGALTPNRKVPVIIDDDGPGGASLTLWESGAILFYLAEKSGRLMSEDPTARLVTLQWLMFQMAGIGPMFGQHSHFRLFATEASHQYSRARYGTEVQRLFDVVETRLAEAPYLAGAEYSIADVAAWPWLRVTEPRGVDIASLPNVARWTDAINRRPAVIRALKVIDTIERPDVDRIKEDNPDALDRYLGRGRYSRVRPSPPN